MAERFEVSLRTVYRDIKTLQDAGVPIGSENGVGYYMVQGYRLPPISLSEEEANSLIIAEKFIKDQGDESLDKNFTSLLIKIKATLKNFQKANLELLESLTFSYNKEETIASNWVSEIQKSISSKNVLCINYHSISKEELTTRKIEPLAVYYNYSSWIVVAFCQLRENIREFRLDRIVSSHLIGEPFKYNLDFDFKKYCTSFRL